MCCAMGCYRPLQVRADHCLGRRERMITVHVLMKRHLVAQAQSEKSRFGGMIVFVGANALFFLHRFVILSVKGIVIIDDKTSLWRVGGRMLRGTHSREMKLTLRQRSVTWSAEGTKGNAKQEHVTHTCSRRSTHSMWPLSAALFNGVKPSMFLVSFSAPACMAPWNQLGHEKWLSTNQPTPMGMPLNSLCVVCPAIMMGKRAGRFALHPNVHRFIGNISQGMGRAWG